MWPYDRRNITFLIIRLLESLSYSVHKNELIRNFSYLKTRSHPEVLFMLLYHKLEQVYSEGDFSWGAKLDVPPVLHGSTSN